MFTLKDSTTNKNHCNFKTPLTNMTDTPNKLAERLTLTIEEVKAVINNTNAADLANKPDPEKWSKKEILGHLIDSGINNLQRFTEVRFKTQPYIVRRYSQDELVTANGYQHANIEEVLSCWLAVNTRIVNVVRSLPPDLLSAGIILPDGEKTDLAFLIADYIDHMAHHNEQLKKI
jgi:hypothetical protein